MPDELRELDSVQAVCESYRQRLLSVTFVTVSSGARVLQIRTKARAHAVRKSGA